MARDEGQAIAFSNAGTEDAVSTSGSPVCTAFSLAEGTTPKRRVR
jgi:hypothetical protein